MSIQSAIKKAEAFLAEYQREEGWGYTIHNQQPFVEPSSWCLLFLNRSGHKIDKGLEWLASYQNADGGWPNIPGGPSDIRTANALLVLNESDTDWHFKVQRKAGLQWLATHQNSVGGWSWCEESWSFTEPTCLTVLAMQTSRLYLLSSSYIDFILEYQCQDGGWGSHAPSVLGRPQASMPSVASWALIALKYLEPAGQDEPANQDPAVLNGLAYIKNQIASERIRSPYSLALCLRTLIFYDADHDVQKQGARRLIRLQGENGGWSDNILWTAIAGITLLEYQQK